MSVKVNVIVSFLLIFMMASCLSNSKDIVGKWVLPISGQPDKSWGFELIKDGSAKSINASTMLYESWILRHDTLFLSGKSIGIGQTISFTDTLIVKEINAKSLLLKTTGDHEFSYTLLE